jgi:hypothetical protein
LALAFPELGRVVAVADLADNSLDADANTCG